MKIQDKKALLIYHSKRDVCTFVYKIKFFPVGDSFGLLFEVVNQTNFYNMKIVVMSIFCMVMACQSTKHIKEDTSTENTMVDILDDILKSEIIVLKVAPWQIDCIGAHGDQKCLQIKTPGAREWDWEYDAIVGFEYIEGYTYTLKVKKEELANPPEDASSIRYTLLEVLSKEKEITDEEIELYETLTVTNIESGKDGYTASLKDANGGRYTCVISIPNLEDNYVRLQVGDNVKIAGEYAESDPVQIFAKRIKKINN